MINLKSLTFFLFTVHHCITFAAEGIIELEWNHLAPPNYDITTPDVNHFEQSITESQVINAPIVPELNGKYVKIPGFVVPLTSDKEKVTEFLLVPYYGACIHVPPPPSNQIIHIKMPNGVPYADVDDPVWITGIITTKAWSGELAQVGYSMTATKLQPYDDF